jgi:hypothetical protein
MDICHLTMGEEERGEDEEDTELLNGQWHWLTDVLFGSTVLVSLHTLSACLMRLADCLTTS